LVKASSSTSSFVNPVGIIGGCTIGWVACAVQAIKHPNKIIAILEFIALKKNILLVLSLIFIKYEDIFNENATPRFFEEAL
jgi:uncharacterized membrane protein